MDGAMHPRSAFDKRWDSWRRNSFDVLKELISAVSRSRALLRDGDHPPKGRKFGAMFLFASEEAIPSTDAMARMLLCHSASREVGRLELWMNRMLTEGKLSLTTGACRNSKLVVERGMLLVLEQWEIIWKCFSFPGHGLFELIFPFAHEETYFRGIAASLSEEIGSFLDMFTPPTEAEEGLLRKNRDEDLLRKKRDEEARLLSAFADLALLYLYLVGLIDRGGTRTYSSGSLLYSSTFVSIVLVLAFYVWFKSRAAPRRGYHRSSPSGLITIEARYKPPGAPGNFSLGVCADDEEAGIKKEIAACYYDRHPRWLAIQDREECFEIPLTPSVPANLDAVGKRTWVKTRVKEVYEEYKRFAASLPNPPVQHTSVAFDPEIRLEDMDQDLFYIPEAMFDSLAVETQHVPEAVPIMFPAPGGHHSEVAVGGGAAQVILQSNSCEVPPTLSASRASPGTDVVFFQQLSAPLAGPSNMDQPQNTTLDLSPFALKLVRCLVQQNEEQARKIVDLEREVERLRSISQCQ